MDSRKSCSGCREEKLISEFNKDKSRADGLSYICKKCNSARSHSYWLRVKSKTTRPVGYYGKITRAKREELKDQQGHLLKEGCQRCKYNGCAFALHMHHILGKDRPLNYRMEEAQKCIWLCANCHYEVHEQLKLGKDLFTYEKIKNETITD